jgi:hypothetical protein
MVSRPRTRQLRRAVVVAALGALVVPATAGAATKKTPVITNVTPKTAYVGAKLTITGKNFKRGKAKNSVQFRADGGKTLFVKADVSTAKKLTVVLPETLSKYMLKVGGQPVATRFRVRVLSAKLGKTFTRLKASPLVVPKGGEVKPPAPDPKADCDGDGLTNEDEDKFNTFACTADSDGDGIGDGFEYGSAVDLNNDDYRNPTSSLPYPGKRPYPNPRDASDANLDHDGDSLTLAQEFELWRYTLNGATPSSDTLKALDYSAGLKYSKYKRDGFGRRVPALEAAGYGKQSDFVGWVIQAGYAAINLPDEEDVNFFNLNRDRAVNRAPEIGKTLGQLYSEATYLDTHGVSVQSGPDTFLSDDERDEDADGLSNLDEYNMRMTSAWWKAMYTDETPYVIPYAGTSAVDPDSDGDGLRDGADDQDHDDVPNFHEISRNMVNGLPLNKKTDNLDLQPTADHGRVNPFNPCLPFDYSRTCPVTVPFENPWAPFNRAKTNYFTFN